MSLDWPKLANFLRTKGLFSEKFNNFHLIYFPVIEIIGNFAPSNETNHLIE